MSNESTTIKSSLDTWHGQVSRVDNLLNLLSDEDLQKEVAPGRNTGTYLIGHLAAVHDRMLPLLRLGDRLHPELDAPFVENPDKAGLDYPSLTDLRAHWKDVNNALAEQFNKLQPEEWLEKHSSVSDEDFEKEPHRNRLNVLFSRTNHLSYHFGQMAFLKK